MVKKISLAALMMAVLFILPSCSSLDVAGKESINSFDRLMTATTNLVSKDDMNGGWSLKAPDGSARFIWSLDYSKSPLHDVMLELDATPFVNAGLDVSKLPAGMAYDNMLMVGTKLGTQALTYSGEATPLESFKKIVETKRAAIKYHTALDHYGVDLGNGNGFEWAKDMSTNDKDIVFVLDPKVLTDAGVDPNKVEGWVFAKVKVDDANGKPIEVDKFLKPFSLQ
jgi:hypothetical protein